MIRAFDGSRQILQTTQVSSPDIHWRHIVTSGQHSVSDSFQVDLDILRADINEYNFESKSSRLKLHE